MLSVALCLTGLINMRHIYFDKVLSNITPKEGSIVKVQEHFTGDTVSVWANRNLIEFYECQDKITTARPTDEDIALYLQQVESEDLTCNDKHEKIGKDFKITEKNICSGTMTPASHYQVSAAETAKLRIRRGN